MFKVSSIQLAFVLASLPLEAHEETPLSKKQTLYVPAYSLFW